MALHSQQASELGGLNVCDLANSFALGSENTSWEAKHQLKSELMRTPARLTIECCTQKWAERTAIK